MRISVKRLCCLSCSVLCAVFSLLKFSAVSVSAVPSGGAYMLPSDALAMYGNTISAEYYNGTEYKSFEFVYDSEQSIDSVYSSVAYPDSVYVGAPYLLYKAPVDALPSYNTDPAYITVKITPQYSITNTRFIHTFIGLSDYGSNSTVYQSPSYDWIWSGESVHIENPATDPSVSGGQACFGEYETGMNRHVWSTFIPVDLTASALTSGYSVRANFSGNSIVGYESYLCLSIGIPYVTDGASGSAGTLPPEESQPDINVNVSVDMSGMESRLDDVAGGINDINSAIYGDEGADGLSSLDDLGVPSLQFDYSTVDDVGEVLDDVPDEVAAAGFWWTLAFDVLHFDSPFWAIVPLLALFALMRYLLWRG